MRGLYAVGTWVANALLWLASAWGHPKARLAVQGRRGWEDRFKAAQSAVKNAGKTGRWIHVHCASLGEYEQAAPVLSHFRRMAPDRPVLLTFFSPSGREAVRRPQADHVDYLPFDTPMAAKRFAQWVKPADTVLVKYELWPNLITALHQSGTRIHLIAARFDAGRHPTNGWGGWTRKRLRRLVSIHVQDEASQRVLSSYGLDSTVSGDPRADRVLDILDLPAPEEVGLALDRIQKWKGKRRLLLVGSAWDGEWNALRAFRQKWPEDWAFLVVPHDIQGVRVDQWCSSADVIRYSDHAECALPPSAGLVLDRVGCLRDGYALADLAVVGGGWRTGVHNTLEPAAHGVPIAVGPKVAGFREISGLESAGALTVCATEASLVDWLEAWTSPDAEEERNARGRAAKGWVTGHRGAAEHIAIDVLNQGRAEEND